jgi:GT2 family glycosyltransferase
MITTLIPAYKPTFIDELLHSLATQTYKQFKVIVSDDSPDGIVTQVIQSKQLSQLTQQLNVTVIRGPQQGGYSNIFNLVRNYANSSDYFHILLDDDVIYPTFYETHVREHQKSNALVSVSARWNVNKQGQPFALTMDYATSKAFEQDFRRQTSPTTWFQKEQISWVNIAMQFIEVRRQNLFLTQAFMVSATLVSTIWVALFMPV